MDYVFSQHDLSYLDDVMPEKDKKKKEDEKKKKKKKGSIDSQMNDVSLSLAASSNVFKINLTEWLLLWSVSHSAFRLLFTFKLKLYIR